MFRKSSESSANRPFHQSNDAHSDKLNKRTERKDARAETCSDETSNWQFDRHGNVNGRLDAHTRLFPLPALAHFYLVVFVVHSISDANESKTFLEFEFRKKLGRSRLALVVRANEIAHNEQCEDKTNGCRMEAKTSRALRWRTYFSIGRSVEKVCLRCAAAKLLLRDVVLPFLISHSERCRGFYAVK